jgi:pilus assembly protein Flp/PilA
MQGLPAKGNRGQHGNFFLEVGMKSQLRRFMRDTSGATAIEYGLIAAGISVAIIAVVNTLGGQLVTTFSSVSDSIKNAGN